MFNFNSREIVTAALLFFAIFGTSLYSFLNLPLVDLLPYRKGVNLTEIVLKNQKARKIEYNTVLVYRNIESGVTREFTLTDNEWHNESLWEWVETKSIALDNPTKGMSTPFAIVNSKGEDVTLNLITMGRLHIICITKFNAISRTCEQNLEGYIKSANVKKEQVIIITPQELGSVNSPLDSDVELYNIDPLTMRNLLRSKNGVVVINRGIIENKINCRNL